MKKLLAETAGRAVRYVTGIGNRQVAPLPATGRAAATIAIRSLGGFGIAR